MAEECIRGRYTKVILVDSNKLEYLYGDGKFVHFQKMGHSSETISPSTIRVKIGKDMLFLFKVDGTFEPLYSSLRKFPGEVLRERAEFAFIGLRMNSPIV